MEPTNASVHAADTEQAPEEPTGDTGVKSRRKMMKAAGAAAVGGFAWAASQAAASASSGDNLVIGQANDAGTDSTALTAAGSTAVDTPTLKVDSSTYDSHVRLAGKLFGLFTNAQYGGIQAIGSSFGAYGVSTDSPDSVGVRGDGGGVGVEGFAGTIGGVGVLGVAYSEDDGTGFGVKGEQGHPDGIGVIGSNPAGTATKGEGKIGVHGKTNADDTIEGYGLKGEAKTKKGAGMLATNTAAAVGPLPSLDAKVGVRAHGDDMGVYAEGAKAGMRGKAAEIGGHGVQGIANASDTGTGYGVKGEHTHPDGKGVYGSNPAGTATKGEGKIGVHGKTNADDTIEGYGLKGEAKTKKGAGMLATNTAAAVGPLPSLDAKVGVRAHGDDMGVYAEGAKAGMRGKAAEIGGHGVQGIANASDTGTGYGVKGEHTHPDGKGVYGSNPAGTGAMGEAKIGVHGKSPAADGIGTLGENTDPGGVGSRGRGGKFGVLGDTSSPDGSGVMGFNSAVPLPGPVPATQAGRKARRNRMPAPLAAATASGLYTGVTGVGDDVGVKGYSNAGTGVAASTNTGTALDVTGKARFDSAGESGQTVRPPSMHAFTVPSIPAGKSSVKVSDPRITTRMFINVMLTSDPGKSGDELPSVAYIARAAGSFTIFLTDKVAKKTNFAYYFVELAPPGRGVTHKVQSG